MDDALSLDPAQASFMIVYQGKLIAQPREFEFAVFKVGRHPP